MNNISMNIVHLKQNVGAIRWHIPGMGIFTIRAVPLICYVLTTANEAELTH
jgi:hypothetical protein